MHWQSIHLIHECPESVTGSESAASVQARERGGELFQQTVSLALAQLPFRDQTLNVVHEVMDGLLRNDGGRRGLAMVLSPQQVSENGPKAP